MTASNPDQVAQELLDRLNPLLQNFQAELSQDDLRRKVQALIPLHEALAALDRSLIPPEIASSARDRLLHYFLTYPFIILPREELLIVGAIDNWARRVRELRVEFGWSILSGKTARAMAEEGEFPLANVDVSKMRPDDYIMTDPNQDLEAAYRWHVAKEIRNRNISIRDKVLAYLQENVNRPVSGEELRYVAKDRTEWARRVRELRTEYGWPIVTQASGRPDLPVGVYLLESLRQSPEHDRQIPDRVRRQVLRRDNYLCRRCNWSHELWNRSDARHLELHHIQAHAEGGENSEDNLITLCTSCHDDWHISRKYHTEEEFISWLKTG
jgi:hypothetical protein